MATTEDGIWTPDQIEDYNLVTDLATMSSTIQDALDKRANAYRGTSTQRNSFTSNAPEGTIWVDTNGDKEVWVKQGNAWVSILGRSRIVEENLNATRGYVRYGDGRQEAWVTRTVDISLSSWSSVYYQDHLMGDWAAPFSRLDFFAPSILHPAYWAGTSQQSPTSAGRVRTFRPNATGNSGVEVGIRGWGMWD